MEIRLTPAYGQLANANARYIPAGTKIYRGLRVPKDQNLNVRQILLSDFKKSKKFDPWTLDFSVAERFTRGTALDQHGYSLGMDNTKHLIVEAELDGPSKDQVDWQYWGQTIAGQGVSKGNVDSYWNPHMIGHVGVDDNHIENEIPILHSAYPSLKLTAVYFKDFNQKWVKNTDPNVLG